MYLDLEYIFFKIYLFFVNALNFIVGQDGVYSESVFWIKIIMGVLSGLFAIGIIYNLIGYFKLNKKRLTEFVKTILEETPPERASKWDKINKQIESNNSSDWQRAVLMADSLVDEIIKRLGYKGETFGERLSKIKPSQFKNINELWEAHKVRNRIAHEAGSYNLTREEAGRALGLYEKVLKELEYL